MTAGSPSKSKRKSTGGKSDKGTTTTHQFEIGPFSARFCSPLARAPPLTRPPHPQETSLRRTRGDSVRAATVHPLPSLR